MKERIKAICLEKPNNVVVKEVPYPEKSDNCTYSGRINGDLWF